MLGLWFSASSELSLLRISFVLVGDLFRLLCSSIGLRKLLEFNTSIGSFSKKLEILLLRFVLASLEEDKEEEKRLSFMWETI